MAAEIGYYCGVVLVVLLTVTWLAPAQAYTIGTTCLYDSDCGNSTSMYCSKMTTVLPPCSRGTCQCRSGYIYDGSSACLQYTYLGLYSTCSGAINEVYPWGSNCSQASVQCMGPTYAPATPTKCLQLIQQKIYGQQCSTLANATTLACNSSLNYACSTASNTCGCSATAMLYSSSLSSCQPRKYGDACISQSDCDSSNYTDYLSIGGGPDCVSSTCACASGFSLVQRLYYDGITRTTLNTCLKGATANLGLNQACTVTPERASTGGALVCSTNYACIHCPEDTTAPTSGTCRSVLSATCSTAQTSGLSALSGDQIATVIKICAGGSNGKKRTTSSSETNFISTLFCLIIILFKNY